MNAAKASAAFGGDDDEVDGSSPAVTTIASTSRPAAEATAPAPYKARPARKQITAARLDAIRQAADKSGQTGQAYNVWYNKWSGGDREDSMANKTKAETRVDIARDSGYTRADQGAVGAYTCLFFARGYCPLGPDCSFQHKLPSPEALPEQGRDIFGREKHGDYRDDMGGVGSLQRVNRTLYIGRIVEESDNFSRPTSQGGGANSNRFTSGAGPVWKGGAAGAVQKKTKKNEEHKEEVSGTEKVIRRHFSEFGEIQRVRVLHTRSCAFVTYTSEPCAQFAKEAMSNQSLDHNEVLNVRWATDDPNQGAQKRDAHERQEQGKAAIASQLTQEQIEAGEQLRQLEDAANEDEESSKRRRLNEAEEDEEYKRLVEENERGWAEIEAEALLKEQAEQDALEAAAAAAAEPQPEPNRYINADTLGGLKYLQTLRAQQLAKAKPVAAAKPSALGGIAAYGSDSEEED